jgi:hypothetical protein
MRETIMADPAGAVAELAPEDVAALHQGDEELIVAFVTTHSLREAATRAGRSLATMYRRLKDPTFVRLLGVSRRRYLDETLDALVRKERLRRAAVRRGLG